MANAFAVDAIVTRGLDVVDLVDHVLCASPLRLNDVRGLRLASKGSEDIILLDDAAVGVGQGVVGPAPLVHDRGTRRDGHDGKDGDEEPFGGLLRRVQGVVIT